MRLIKEPFAFLSAVAHSAEALGSEQHKEFSRAMRDWQGDRSTAQFVYDTMDVLLEALLPRVSREMAVSTMRDMAPFVAGSATWAELGFPVIALTHDFYRAIAVTDFGDAGDEPLFMPFPSFILRLPESLGGEDQSTPLFIHPIPTKHVVSNEDKPRLSFAEGGESLIPVEDLTFDVSRMMLTPEPNETAAKRGSFTSWENGVPLDRFLNGRVQSLDQTDPLEAKVTSALGQSFDPEMTKRARRVLGNTMLYISSTGGLPPEKKIGSDVQVEREHREPRFRVGRPIKLGARLKEAIRQGLRTGTSWELDKGFWVRGHWRNQAYGPQHGLRRRKYIVTYWKGPEDVSEALERKFEVT